MAKSQAIMEDIEPHYHTLVDTLEFKENAFHLFTDISNSISTMKVCFWPIYPSLTVSYPLSIYIPPQTTHK